MVKFKSFVPLITLTSHAPGGGAGSKCKTLRFWPYFDFVAAGGIHVSQTHVLYIISNILQHVTF